MKRFILAFAMLSGSLAFADPQILEQGVKALDVSIDGQAVQVNSISYEVVKGRAFCKQDVNPTTGEPSFRIFYGAEVFAYARSKKMSTRIMGISKCEDMTISATPIDGDEVDVLLYSNEFINDVLSSAFAGKW